MRKWIALMVVMAGISASHAALACGSDEDSPQVRVTSEADRLRLSAARLEENADSDERTALAMDRQAERTTLGARELRARLSFAGELQRAQLLARIDRMVAEAATSHANATQLRAEAAQLRASARGMRERAIRLASGGGWRVQPDLATGIRL